MTDTVHESPSTALVAGAAPASKSALTAMSMVQRGAGGGIVLMPTNFGEVIAMAEMMARASTAVPKHLRENAGACMAVIIRATGWEMDAFAVATKTYLVNDQIAYESQLVSAVVNMRAPVKGRPRISYSGEGQELSAHFEYTMLDGDVLVYDSPKLKDIKVQNSPLWKADPQQQLFYYSARAWARRWVPEVLMGVYTPDEVAVRAEEEGDVAERATSFAAMEARASETIQDAVIEEIKPQPAEVAKTPPQRAKAAASPAAKAQVASPASNAGTETAAGTPGSGDTTTTASAGSGVLAPSPMEAAEHAQGFGEAMGRPTETASAQDAADGPDSSDSATDASTVSAPDNSFPGDSGQVAIPAEDTIAEGYPAVDEVYHLNGDAWDEHGIRDIYRNGEPVGTARREDGALIYEDHRPERAQGAVAPEIPPEFSTYLAALAATTEWPQDALRALKTSAAWPAAPLELQIRIHTITFVRLQELRKNGYDFNWLANLHAYRCYIDQEWSADALKQNRATACSGKTWMDLATPGKIQFDKAHEAQFARIQARAEQAVAPAEFS